MKKNIFEQIRGYSLENYDVFSSFVSANNLKYYFGRNFKLFKAAYEMCRLRCSHKYSYLVVLNNMLDIVQNKINVYDFSAANLKNINEFILAAIMDSGKKWSQKLIAAFSQSGVETSLRCFAIAESEDGHEFVLQSIKSAGNQLGVFNTLFYDFGTTSDKFKKFIIPKIIEHQFYRYKYVTECVAAGYNLTYPIENAKSFMTAVWDILSGNYHNYLNTQDAKTSYMLHNLLYKVDRKAYDSYLAKMLVSENKMQRFLAFYYVSLMRKDKEIIAEKHFAQDDLEMYAPLLDCLEDYPNPAIYRDRFASKYKTKIDSKTVAVYRSLYVKLTQLLERLPKKNNSFPITSDVWFAHAVGEEETVLKIVHILKSLDDAAFIRDFEDKYYDRLSSVDKLMFINAFKDKIKHDYRIEMLNYFTATGYYLNEYKEYFAKNPLTFSEAVIASDFLKTKRTNIKKNIVEHFAKMCEDDKRRLKEYLENAAEEYKRECAQDITLEKAIKQETKSVPVAALPKYTIKSLSKSKVQDILKAIRDVILSKKDTEITLKSGEKVLFGSQNWLPIDENGRKFFADEVNAVIDSFNLNDGELAAVIQTMFEAGETNTGALVLGEKMDDFWKNYGTVVNSFLESYVRGYIIEKQTAALQTEILQRLTDVFGSIKQFPKPNASVMYHYGLHERKLTQDERLLTVSNRLAELINYSVTDTDNLKLMKTLIDYAKGASGWINPLSHAIILSKLHGAGLILADEISAFLKDGFFKIAHFFETPYHIAHNNGDKETDANIFTGKFSDGFVEIIKKTQAQMLDVEMQRAQSETQYTKIILSCKRFLGIGYYLNALKAFQKMTLPREPYGTTRDAAFAMILARTEPQKSDTYEQFCALVKELRLGEKDLIKGVLYSNNQTILDWTARLVDKRGFVSCVMFFKAHLKDSAVSGSVRDKIALFSPIEIEDFKEGAVDTDWFFAMKAEVDEETFSLIYDNAKYITVGNLHKRAQRFSDALTNKLTKAECLEKINDTRNKEFLLCYSLIPLENENDLTERYLTVQRFLQESKQFGAQRQTSEKKCCEIALENIARTAGYEDTDRFIWFMESKDASRIAPYFEPKLIDGVEVFLKINDRFKVSVQALKDGKALSSIPARLKSDKYLAEMKEQVPPLNKQSSRVIKSLENAMERGAVFSETELKQISQNPVINEILKALFFISNGQIIRFDGADFVGLNSEKGQTDKLYIAHPLDFFKLRQWEAVQRYVLENKIRQPFKQAFREFYPKTADELDANETNRYHGHQISAQKAIAVAKNRGWHTGEDIGLQKVYYKENIVAVLFGVWDFGYSSFDDHPTISSVYFLHRKADEAGNMKIIPLKDIDDRMFSEVMRDVDLIVSTAHPLGYDFEESLSTVEVRRQVCASVIDLLNLTNTTIDGHHIRINGTYGEYAINLKSGNAYKQLSGALNIMAINDSTQNKLFISFVDDNPKTAEVVSKMLLLADDKKIKDADIVAEIKK